MSFRFLPSLLLRKIAPKKQVEKLVTGNLTLNRTVLTQLSQSGVLSKKKLETIALRVLKQYKEKYAEERDSGETVSDAKEIAIADNRLMVQRVQNSIVHEISKDLKSEYRGEFYRWLPSSANVPDPLHQLNYGRTFQLGKGDDSGEDPGDRFGCLCGLEMLVDDTKLEL